MKTASPPDPMQTAQAQSGMNKDTAIAQSNLASVNQVTPYGNLTYSTSGTNPDGTPIKTATQTLSPEQQQLYNLYTQGQQQYGNIANTQLQNVAQTLSTPFDMNAGRATELSDINKTFLDPQWSQRDEALESKLYNQGVQPGTEAYDRAMRNQGQQRNDAYNQMYLGAYNTANQAALTERNQPLTEITSLLSGAQPQQPSFTSTPAPGVAPVDYSGLVQQNYGQKMQQQNALYGALGGLGGMALGGWAQGGFK
jgi:hypothetical protein